MLRSKAYTPTTQHWSVLMLVTTTKKLVTMEVTCFFFLVNRVDYERMKDVGPDRAASEWLLRCGAKVRYCGHQKWLQDYNKLPAGSIDRYKIQAIDATDSCIMDIGLDHMGKPRLSLASRACRRFARNVPYSSLSVIVMGMRLYFSCSRKIKVCLFLC